MVSIQRLTFMCYAGVLFLGTHIPLARHPRAESDSWLGNLVANVAEFGHVIMIGNRDKLIHFAAYTILTLLAFWAAASYPRIRGHLSRSLFSAIGLILLAALLAWGLIDEATQPLFGRSFQWNDYAANAIGICAGASAIAAAIALRSVSPDSAAMAEVGR